MEAQIPARTKFCYGLGELGPAMAGSTLVFFQLIFLTNVAGLAAGLAGTVLLVSKVWDAANDPFIGWLSDNTRSRWGRRLPWILYGALPFAFCFFLLWWVPPFLIGNSTGLFIYYVIIAMLFSVGYTTVALPHSALTPELSRDYDERSRITGFRMANSLAGSVGGLVVAAVVLQVLKESPKTTQYGALGGSIAVVIAVSLAICLIGIWRIAIQREIERRADPDLAAAESKPMPIREQLRIVAANKPFLLVCGIYLFSWLAMQFTAAILPYYIQSWLRLPQAQFNLLALTVQGTALAMIPFWGWLTVRLGKKPVYFIAMPFWLAAQAALVFLQPGAGAIVFALGAMAGLGISVCYLIPNAMLPDTIEYDELVTGQRREGVFYGFFVFLQKLALALGTAVIGYVLQASGYISSGPDQVVSEQPESALLAIRIAIGPLPAAAIIVGFVLVALFPINKARHAQILLELQRRKVGA